MTDPPPASAAETARPCAPIVVIMGVSGAGKTTVGRALAQRTGWPFLDADAFHPTANVRKMRRGEPLTDADRRPWLDALQRSIAEHAEADRPAVFTCSALKRAYREHLARPHAERLFWVHLWGTPELIAQRLGERQGHFMPAELLQSQFASLEAPAGALVLDVTEPPERLADAIVAQLPCEPQP